jgi:hypothetical protein
MAERISARQTLTLLTDDEIQELHDFGAQLASTGHDAARTEDIHAIEAHAKAFAAARRGEPYDPEHHPHDRLWEERYRRDLAEFEEHAKPAVEFAAARVRELEHELARHDKGLVRPEIPAWIVPTGITALTLTIAPTLHDQFFTTLYDELLAWLAAGACGAFVAAFVVWTLLGTISTTGHRTTMNVVGLLAGLGIGVGLGILRVAYAATPGEYVFAVALTIIEMSAVLAVEFVASGLRSEHAAWRHQENELNPLRTDLKAALSSHAHLQTAGEALERRHQEHIAYVELRQFRHLKAQDIDEAARAAAERGYREQLTENWRIRTGAHHHLRRVV